MAQLFAGSSGFAYPSWKPDFYPPKVPQARFLEHYASRLNSVEINYTFRRHPAAATLTKWKAATPDGFSFSVKAHQRITHVARLKDAAEPIEFFLGAIDPLRASRRLGVLLFQLPPNLKKDVALLREFLALLPADLRCAFEFRHESWYAEQIYDVLRERNICLCQAESEKLTAPDVQTADFIYFRLRKGEYSADERLATARKARELLDRGTTLFLYYKHEESAAGALYAEEVLERVRKG